MNRRGVALMSGAHVVDDLYQGAVPALLPFLVVVLRSIMFFGLTSFLALYVIGRFGASQGEGGAVLTAFLVAGACGTLLGGVVADRWGRLATIRLGFGLAVPALLGLVLSNAPWAAAAFVVLTGAAVYLPFSVFVVLDQDYLPHRIGTASGVTVGLAVSVGGLFSPLLGALADATSLRVTLSVLLALPVLALLVTTVMQEPTAAPREPRASTAPEPPRMGG